jgi:prepilin-type N-terminal cleavage/methylation domain-containing protein
MRHRLADERGVTLIELLFVCLIMGILLAGLANVFVSGSRASADATGRLASQQNTRLALDRLEFESRCATTATLVSSGVGVALNLPSQCSHASGSVTWCVTSGVLTRYLGTACTGTSQPFVSGITSAAPFSCVAPVGPLPQLQVGLTVNTTGRSADATTVSDTITLRNALPTTATASSCT